MRRVKMETIGDRERGLFVSGGEVSVFAVVEEGSEGGEESKEEEGSGDGNGDEVAVGGRGGGRIGMREEERGDVCWESSECCWRWWWRW